MAGQPLSPATDRRLGEPLPHQLANRPRVHLRAINLWWSVPCSTTTLCGISTTFAVLFHTPRQVTHVLRTSPPLSIPSICRSFNQGAPFDLHVLSTPPAFILSQDQTLYKNKFYRALHSSLSSKFLKTRFRILYVNFVKVVLKLILTINEPCIHYSYSIFKVRSACRREFHYSMYSRVCQAFF